MDPSIADILESGQKGHLLESRKSHQLMCHYVYVISFCLLAPTSASQQDPYTLLGVKKSASQSEIKKAYYQVNTSCQHINEFMDAWLSIIGAQ